MSKFKTLSATLIASAFVLAGCNTMSGMGEDLKRGGEKLGIGSKEKAEQTAPATTTTEPGAADPGTTTDPNTGMPADASQGGTTDVHTGHDAATQPPSSTNLA